jgi:beta-1,4-mannosyltransferase
MQYHALALAARGHQVALVGYEGKRPRAEILTHPRITCHRLRPAALRARPWLPRALFAPATLVDAVSGTPPLLARLLAVSAGSDVLLVQTPPAVPTLALALLAARARGARLVLDWHNLGHTMLALRLGRGHPAVRLMRRVEEALGRRADAHLCVSDALRRRLLDRGMRDVTVFRDRPAAAFAPLPPADRAEVRRWLGAEVGAAGAADGGALVVSPTSWTADEDFDLLLEALPRCDQSVGVPVLLLLTGDGPRRAAFQARARALALRRIVVRTHWLAAEQYPRVLGAADLGLCLHRSSSGLDLPMKALDMLGAGIPPLALDYGPCLREALRDGENAVLFDDALTLAARLGEVLEGFPAHAALLARLRRGVASSRGPTWEQAWLAEAAPVLGAEGASAAPSTPE